MYVSKHILILTILPPVIRRKDIGIDGVHEALPQASRVLETVQIDPRKF